MIFPCDLCRSTDALELPHAGEYTGGQLIHICRGCGFVYVRERRSAEEIAASWTNEIFGSGYSASLPAVTARLTYVAETLDIQVGLRGKRIAEIGAGEGHFLAMVREERYGATVFGIEPSAQNCADMRAQGVDCFNGTIEEFDGSSGEFDLVVVLWTLENCQDPRALLGGARRLLRPGGQVAVATGSRILVPFKKPLHAYLSRNPVDTNSFRFSANTIQGALAVSGLETSYVNRYLDHDVLLAIGRPAAEGAAVPWHGDDPLAVWGFFERWHADTALYFPDLLQPGVSDRS